MKTYKFAVSLCGGWCSGHIDVRAASEDAAYDKAMDRVAKKLTNAFPTLGIDYNVECENPDEDYDDYYHKSIEDELVEKIRGANYTEIEDFLGYPISAKVLENLEDRIREVLDQMPDEEFLLYKQKYLTED
jgi:hypothetical protein